jgi:hypothetical protein
MEVPLGPPLLPPPVPLLDEGEGPWPVELDAAPPVLLLLLLLTWFPVDDEDDDDDDEIGDQSGSTNPAFPLAALVHSCDLRNLEFIASHWSAFFGAGVAVPVHPVPA